jgi:transcriptional regulator with XRE-family HTH domain
MELSKKIVLLRQKKGWSQIDLARAAGIPQPTICRLESGDIEQPKIMTLMKIARALEVSSDYLLSEEYEVAQTRPPALAIKARVAVPQE